MSVRNMYKLIKMKLGSEVEGINLESELRPNVIDQIKEDLSKHSLLLFRNQGIISGHRQVAITKWFGDLESTFFKHSKSPHPHVFRVSNCGYEGCTGVGRTGWHIDGSFMSSPFSYSLYHIVSTPEVGDTCFVSLTELYHSLTTEKQEEWNRIWMMSDRYTGPLHPLVYHHPVTGKKVLCFHLGMMDAVIFDYETEKQKFASGEEHYRLLRDIHNEIIKNDEKLIYRHKWKSGDFIITDNLAVAHEASPQTQYPVDQVGLRILHRTTVKGCYKPKDFK